MICTICNNKMDYNKEEKIFFCECCNKYYDINLNEIANLSLYRKIEDKLIAKDYKETNINCSDCNEKLDYNKINKTFFCKECNKYYDIKLKEIKKYKSIYFGQ